MANLFINTKKRTIEMTKAFEKKACFYGTDEYNQLQAVRRDYPTFSIVVRKSSKKKNGLKLTYDKMEAYIQKHDDENNSIMAEFNKYRGKTDEGEIFGFAYSYHEIKEWFLATFPEVEQFVSNKEDALKAIIKEKKEKNEKNEKKNKINKPELVANNTEEKAG